MLQTATELLVDQQARDAQHQTQQHQQDQQQGQEQQLAVRLLDKLGTGRFVWCDAAISNPLFIVVVRLLRSHMPTILFQH